MDTSRVMENALEMIETALALVDSTGYEAHKCAEGYVVTIYGVKEGCKPYATKSKQAYAVGKSFSIAFTKALKLFKEGK